MGGWMDVKAILSIAYNNQKSIWKTFFFNSEILSVLGYLKAIYSLPHLSLLLQNITIFMNCIFPTQEISFERRKQRAC